MVTDIKPNDDEAGGLLPRMKNFGVGAASTALEAAPMRLACRRFEMASKYFQSRYPAEHADD
ncbi:hypothetical protein A1355_17945 [Methylomonas koyamae]|uniref:Uncharacterized protein n=2 Tax=Methylococcaceae TaxID=403 RepID=A0A177PCU6_9GAMM|nr:hypothetical protein A1355_17945 [Methylomonas koyamae]